MAKVVLLILALHTKLFYVDSKSYFDRAVYILHVSDSYELSTCYEVKNCVCNNSLWKVTCFGRISWTEKKNKLRLWILANTVKYMQFTIQS